MSGELAEIQPFHHLCSIIKSIAEDENKKEDKEVGKECGRRREEAAELVGAISKIMKMGKGNSPASATTTKSLHECSLCKRKCRTKSRLLAHVKAHLRKARVDQRSGNDGDSDQDLDAVAKKRRKKCSDEREDLDSGCHSVGEDESDSFLGDSESSDSDEVGAGVGNKKMERELFLEKGNRIKVASKGDRSARKLSLAEKQLDDNETEGLMCLTCLKRFSNCQNLRRHLKLHISRDSATPDFERGDVDETADDNEQQQTPSSYICDWCPERFSNRAAFRVHEKSHEGDPFRCHVCDLVYADRYSLRYHKRKHGIGRLIRCQHCGKNFAKPSRLDAHVKAMHQNVRQHPCPHEQCGRIFKTAVHLRSHLRLHSGERPFVCQECGQRFRQKSSLLAHRRGHEGVRPYCCEVCGKTFREPSTLKAHSRVHTGAKPYQCPVCDKTFTQRAGLNYHRRVAHEDGVDDGKPFACHLCHFATAKSPSLKSHYRNVHHIYDDVKSVQKPEPFGIVEVSKESAKGKSAEKSVVEAPLPSPPVQSGDALLDVNQQHVNRLPSFDLLRQKTTTTSSSPVPPPHSPPSTPPYQSCYSPALNSMSADVLPTNTVSSSLTREVSPPLTPQSGSSNATPPPPSHTTSVAAAVAESYLSVMEDSNSYMNDLPYHEYSSCDGGSMQQSHNKHHDAICHHNSHQHHHQSYGISCQPQMATTQHQHFQQSAYHFNSQQQAFTGYGGGSYYQQQSQLQYGMHHHSVQQQQQSRPTSAAYHPSNNGGGQLSPSSISQNVSTSTPTPQQHLHLQQSYSQSPFFNLTSGDYHHHHHHPHHNVSHHSSSSSSSPSSPSSSSSPMATDASPSAMASSQNRRLLHQSQPARYCI